jgi:hypothetical protein
MTKLVDQGDGRVVEEDNVTPPPLYNDIYPQKLTADTARQAPLGKPVLLVLAVAIALAVVGLLMAWALSGTAPAT